MKTTIELAKEAGAEFNHTECGWQFDAAALAAFRAMCVAERDALAKDAADAARYRWLRDCPDTCIHSVGIVVGEDDGGWERVDWIYEDAIDAAIDAARTTKENTIHGVYTAPPAAAVSEPLTDEQITAIVREASKGSATRRDGSTSMRIARAIEAAHNIGGKHD